MKNGIVASNTLSMKKSNRVSRAVATDKKRQVILRSLELRHAVNRALLETALKSLPTNLRVTFPDRSNLNAVFAVFDDPDNILFGIPWVGRGGYSFDAPDLPWIRKALADTGAEFALTELA
ncbi:MAG: hypothetical protein AAB447_00410 [Patescibacteria group bacterium]